MEELGPLLVYDTKQRSVTFLTEEQARDAVAKLLALLRTHSLLDIEDVLLRWFSIPRNVTYHLPRFHIENFGSFTLLGNGGFGTVFKATHQIDNKKYAIKVIRTSRSSNSLSLARSEVCMMARLSHENIIQYVTSWIEYDIPVSSPRDDHSTSPTPSVQLQSTSSKDPLSFEHETDSSPESRKPPSTNHSSSSSGILFSPNLNQKQLISSTPSHPKPKLRMMKRSVPRPMLFIQMELCQSNLAAWLEYRNGRLVATPTKGLVPASILLDSRGPARWMTDQIARGVAYLHSKYLMHRDLKPENVLICGPPFEQISTRPCDCRPGRLVPHQQDYFGNTVGNLDTSSPDCYHQLVIKICDFGLARFWKPRRRRFRSSGEPCEESSKTPNGDHLSKNCSRHRSEQNGTSSHQIPQTIHNSKRIQSHIGNKSATSATTTTSTIANISPFGSSDSSPQPSMYWPIVRATRPSHEDLLTANLGSAIYAAPETIDLTSCAYTLYDYKADVFSMGVIFLQIFHPFHTLHELIDTLHAISIYNSPSTSAMPSQPVLPSFSLAWAEESRLVYRMLSRQSESRPSMIEVLQLLTPEFPDLIRYQSTVIIEETNDSIEDLDKHESKESLEVPNEQADRSHEGSPGKPNQVFDFLLHRNRELEQTVAELQQRLSRYEEI